MRQQLLFIALFFIAISTNAQNAISPSGGEGLGNGGTSSYTVGEVFYTYLPGSTTTISQGVQQGIQWIIYAPSTKSFTGILPLLNGLTETNVFTAKIYPNPAIDHFVLVLNNVAIQDLSYKIFDLNGRTVATGLILQKQTTIMLKALSRGSYILSLNQHNRSIKSFVIIKE